MSISHFQGKADSQDSAINKGFFTPSERTHLQKSQQQNDLPKHYRQRIQIMLLTDEGKSQTEICQTLGCDRATVRHWRHIARSGMPHQWQDSMGRPKKINDKYLERLKQLVNGSPRDYGYFVEHWTAKRLSEELAKQFGFEISEQHVNRLLKEMGLSTRQKASNSHTSSRNA